MTNPVTYRREPLTEDREGEVSALVTDYYARTPAHDGLPPYNFNWDLYRQAERAKKLLMVTARCGPVDLTAGRAPMVGVALYLIYEHPHHIGFRLGECDGIGVSPEARGKGVGRGLIAYAETLLKDRGVKRIIHRHRLVYGDNALFPKLGFRAEEVAYFKDI